ncbi:MAG TPA: DUF6683 family protein [Pyrinomonadaceae bacterium]|nr:DUF6683 family protein [Pyrinomonadaceae bacterium]
MKNEAHNFLTPHAAHNFLASRALLSILLCLAFLTAHADAQTYSRGTYTGAKATRWNNPVSASLDRMLNRNILSQSIRRRQSARGSLNAPSHSVRPANTKANPVATPRRTDATANSPASGAGTAFRPVADSIYPQQLAREAATSDAERKEMEAVFRMCLRNYEANMRRQSQPVKDVARAVSYFIGVNYNVLHGGASVSPAEGTALRADVRSALGEDESFQRLSDREKQQIYETMAVLAEFVALNMSVADEHGNKQLAEATRAMAKDNLEKLLGAPAPSIRITERGIEF